MLTKKGSLWLYTSFIVPDGPRLPSMSLSCELSTTDCSSDTWLMAFTRSVQKLQEHAMQWIGVRGEATLSLGGADAPPKNEKNSNHA